MTKYPVTIGFDRTKIIGEIELDETQLPPLPNYHFALGGQILNKVDGKISEFRLTDVSLVDDSKFRSMDETP